MSYPVLSIAPEVKKRLVDHRVVILEAPPGAGKSTVLPLHLLDEPWMQNKKMILLEPRRLAARSVAMRMSDLQGEEVGKTIGYRVRFENKVSRTTRIEVVTEGILARMLQQDNTMEGVGLLVFDEFHERSLHADLALALSLQVQEVLREDLRILIMSATLDGQDLAARLNAPVVRSEGRQFPVEVRYLVPDNAPVALQVVRGIRQALKEQAGDILAFLPGAGEIKRVAEILEEGDLSAKILPLFGDLNFRKQQEAILPDPLGRRKVVLATSIAETSLTIEGVNVVVDSGYSRVPKFDPRSGFTRLETVRVTRDSADQRAGRAGRLGPGVCYRLWSQGTHLHLIDHRNPEILEADLASLMLELAAWNVQRPDELTWVTPPPSGAVNQASALLIQLGALNEENRITPRGRQMLALPTHPRLAHMLLEARDHDQLHPASLALAIDIAATLEERDPLPRGSGADLSLRIEALRRWRRGEKAAGERTFLERIERVALAWRQAFKISANNEAVEDARVGRWLMAAFPERVSKQTEKHSPRYKMVNGRMARLPDNDPLVRESWLAIADVDAGMGEGKIFLAAPLDENDLRPLAAEAESVYWDASREMVIAVREARVGSLILDARPSVAKDPGRTISIICDTLRERGLGFLDWGDEQRGWQARVMSLARWRQNEAWPDVSDEKLLLTAEEWLGPFIGAAYKRSDLLKLDLVTLLNSILPWELSSRLNALAPPRMEVPSGSMIRLQYYMDGRPPVMEVRLQEVFGLLDTPAVNEGKNKIVLHLLSPGFKPVQVTQDLKSFWANTYAEVRKELRARYPKHSWPEDPWTADPIRGAKKRR